MIDYDPHDWLGHFLDIRGSMLRVIFARVSACIGWSVAIVALDRLEHIKLAVPDRAHTLIGVALGLLLVFRTNVSYDRFWESRRLWGSIVNECRNLARISCVYLSAAPERAARLVRWTATFPWACLHALRGGRGLGPVADALPADEVRAVLVADHVPLAVTVRMSRELAGARREGHYSDQVQAVLDGHVQRLVDDLGGCERIATTPLPFAYVVHLRRALTIYCFTLPHAFLDSYGWWTILVTGLCAFILFGVEAIGVEIENPFGHDDNDLPLERFCATIQSDLLGLAAPGPEPAAATISCRQGLHENAECAKGDGRPGEN